MARISPTTTSSKSLPLRLTQVYRRLFQAYGPQRWWPAETPFEVCVGAILTQAASWTNVEKGLAGLKRAGLLSSAALRATPHAEVARLLRPCGFFNAKARKLKAFAEHLGGRYGDDLDALLAQPPEALREELLGIYGIGEETADDILLYAAGQASFVIDAYTRRLLARLGLAREDWPYGRLRALFMEALPQDPHLYNEYHALIVRHGKERCRKQEPLCAGCCLLSRCPTGTARVKNGNTLSSQPSPRGRGRG